MEKYTTLTIGSESFDVLGFDYGFNIMTDAKGRPNSHYFGGNIRVCIASTSNTTIFEHLIHGIEFDKALSDGSFSYKNTISGKIEVRDGEGMLKRLLEFPMAYISMYEEECYCQTGDAMTYTFDIIPLKLHIDKTIKIKRLVDAPKYNGLWQEDEAETTIIATTQSDGDIRITDAYWLDGENQIRDFDVPTPVTLYIVTENCDAGESVSFTFEGEGGEPITFSGSVNGDGIAVIENFELKSHAKN